MLWYRKTRSLDPNPDSFSGMQQICSDLRDFLSEELAASSTLECVQLYNFYSITKSMGSDSDSSKSQNQIRIK
jgi:hypothetical protein